MKILDLSTDVLAIKCIKNYVFVGEDKKYFDKFDY